MDKKNLLLTGLPGVGKTNVLRKVAGELDTALLRGFLSDELREKGKRVGFRIESFDGQEALLSHVAFVSPCRVGRYRVDVAALEAIVDTALRIDRKRRIFIVDEIGKMECFSRKFVEGVTALLDSEQIFIATVARQRGGFVDRVKQRDDIELWEVNRGNRDEMPEKVLAWLQGR